MRYFYPLETIYEKNKVVPTSYLEIPTTHNILTSAASIKMVIYGKNYIKVKDFVTPMVLVEFLDSNNKVIDITNEAVTLAIGHVSSVEEKVTSYTGCLLNSK